MQEKETTTKEPLEYMLDSILRGKHGDGSNTNLIDAPTAITASPEEGVRLIHAFIRIKQPELRAAIVKLATQMADVRTLTIADQN
jgi:hypothetical protein